MRLRVLGAIAVDDAPVRSARVRRLLAVLALEPRRVVTVDRLVACVWPGEPPAHGEAALHSVVARARQVLGGGALRTEAPGYVLDLLPEELDAAAAAALRDRARNGAPDLLDEALALWRGPAFAEFADEEPFRPVAARLDELRADLEDARARADLDLGRPGDAVVRLEELVAAAPLRERRHELLVEALHRAGRPGDALAAVAAHRRLLADELGLDPGPAMRRLEAAVLAGSPAPAPSPPSGAANGPFAASGAANGAFVPAAPRAPGPALLGRDTALSGIAAAIGDAPVTLVGPGGVGKTTLARHVATAAGGAFADGVVVTELAAVAAGSEVAPAVVAAVGAPGASGTDVHTVLRGRCLLLVLDNAEHVVDAAAALVASLRTACPSVAVLATSREPLGVAGERVRPVPPLADDAAVALFVERATAADPAFALTDANRAAVTEVCRRLDRLPLALELAAARMRVLSPGELLADLPRLRHSLRSPHRGADQRHRTLHAVVDWSYRLLDPREQAVLARLAVFAGGFTLAAARAVADEPDLDTVLADLVDKSLVTASVDHARAAPTRYALLETVRSFARERLEERGETAARHRRHAGEARDLLARTGRLAGPDADRRLGAVLAEWDELRAAVAWASAHDPPLAADLVAGLVDVGEVRMTPELFTWADALLAAPADLGASRAGVHAVAAQGARFAGHLDDAEQHVAAGRRALAGSEPGNGAAAVLAYLHAEVAGFAGRSAESARAAADAERLAAAAGDDRVRGLAACCRILAVAYEGDRDEALADADALDAAVRDAADPLLRPWTVYLRGEVRVEHDQDAALELVEDAVDRARAAGEQYALGVALVTVASLRARRGDLAEAARAARASLEHWRGTGDRTHQWVGLRGVAGILAEDGRPELAAELLGGLRSRRSGGAVFGADAARLAELRGSLAARLGPTVLAAAEARGAARDDDGLVDLARDALRGP